MQGNQTADRWREGPAEARAPGRLGVTLVSLAALGVLWIVAATLTADADVLPANEKRPATHCAHAALPDGERDTLRPVKDCEKETLESGAGGRPNRYDSGEYESRETLREFHDSLLNLEREATVSNYGKCDVFAADCQPKSEEFSGHCVRCAPLVMRGRKRTSTVRLY